MRRKGQEKRERLIQATAELLAVKSLHELRAADIVKKAGTSAPNFYLYFHGVDDVVLAAVEGVTQIDPAILAAVQAPWPADALFEHALRFVRAYVDHWRAHAPVLRARAMRVAEGDPRFLAAETQASIELLKSLAAKLAAGPAWKGGETSLHATSTAGVLIAMLDRLAAYLPSAAYERGVTEERLLASAATVVATVMAGPLQGPPAMPAGKAARQAAPT